MYNMILPMCTLYFSAYSSCALFYRAYYYLRWFVFFFFFYRRDNNCCRPFFLIPHFTIEDGWRKKQLRGACRRRQLWVTRELETCGADSIRDLSRVCETSRRGGSTSRGNPTGEWSMTRYDWLVWVFFNFARISFTEKNADTREDVLL